MIVFMVLLGVLFGFLRVMRKKGLAIRYLQTWFRLGAGGIWRPWWRNDGFFADDMNGLSGERGQPAGNGHRGYGIPFIESQNTPVKAPAECRLIRADFNQPGTAIQTQAFHLERLLSSVGIDDIYLYCV